MYRDVILLQNVFYVFLHMFIHLCSETCICMFANTCNNAMGNVRIHVQYMQVMGCCEMHPVHG